jgi:hypothetical protein
VIHIERGRLPAGAQAVALRRHDRIVVYVAEDLSARQRLAAIREVLRAAPAAGWRPSRSPVLLPALALSAGLRQVPESRWSYRMAAVAVAGAALLITAASVTTVSFGDGGVRQPTAAAGAGRPPLAGAGPATSQSAAASGPDGGRQPQNGSSPGQPGAAPKPGKTTTTSAGGAAPPAPQASGTPAPAPTSVSTSSPSSPSPQPSPAASPSPSPSSPPSPAQQSGGSGACVDVLGITVCL